MYRLAVIGSRGCLDILGKFQTLNINMSRVKFIYIQNSNVEYSLRYLANETNLLQLRSNDILSYNSIRSSEVYDM